jgi:hypothetical protein
MAVRFVQLTPASLTASASVVLGASSVKCSSVFIQADPLNTNNIYWGSSACTTTNGFSLAAGEKISISFEQVFGNNTLLTLDSIYLSSDTTGNKARIGYWQVD